MANDRFRNDDIENSYYGRDEDFGRDYGSGRDFSYSSARNYEAAGVIAGRDDRNYRGAGDYRRDRPSNYGGRERYGRDYGGRDYYGGAEQGYGRQRSRGSEPFRGSYAHDGHRFTEVDRDRDQGRGYGRQPEGYDYQDRGFFARAGDEVRSWFGDDEAERRREYDMRNDYGRGGAIDRDYGDWRRGQIDALDRDYHEYRQENAKRFDSEFGTWRSNRQTQRSSLSRVEEHQEVVGSDGEHVGTVDKVRGDRVILTKNDADAGGRHHSFPSSWISSVDDKVTISKTADDAKRHWRDEERSSALFGNDRDDSRASGSNADGSVNLNRSFSGTY